MISGVRTYGISAAARKPLVDFMLSGLQEAGCRILFCSELTKAPFIITFETATGERIGVVVYAFLATRTPTRNRPADERSFQIKYGSKHADNLHALWTDPLGLYTTLLVGIDPDENFFVAADPAAHNPTKFFIRVEFKDEHAEEIRSKGWHAWERARRGAAGFEEPLEVLVGGTRQHFLDLIRFERAAVGLSPGDRQLLAEKPEVVATGRLAVTAGFDQAVVHPLARELSLDPDQILELISNAKRLKMAVRGWVAEEHLRDALARIPDVTKCERLDVEGGPDLHLSYLGRELLTVECKNVLRELDKHQRPRVDFQRTRASKKDPCSRYYSPADFDIVAGCLHAVTERWEFRYVLASELPAHLRCPGKINNNIKIDQSWSNDPVSVFERAYSKAGR